MQDVMSLLIGLGGIAALAALVFAAIWVENWGAARGYWRKRRPGSGDMAGDVMSGFDAFGNPGAQYVRQAKEAKKLEERDSGDPPSLRG
jgi:hypothetical protein